MMSQTSKNTDAMKFTCFQSLFRLKTSIYVGFQFSVVDDWNWVGVLI